MHLVLAKCCYIFYVVSVLSQTEQKECDGYLLNAVALSVTIFHCYRNGMACFIFSNQLSIQFVFNVFIDHHVYCIHYDIYQYVNSVTKS